MKKLERRFVKLRLRLESEEQHWATPAGGCQCQPMTTLSTAKARIAITVIASVFVIASRKITEEGRGHPGAF
jgi:hypothetical protein